MFKSKCSKKRNVCQSNYNIYGRLLYRFKKGCNLFYKALIHEKNYSNWNNAKSSLEHMISSTLSTEYYINDRDWSSSIENTLKIRNNNPLKELQILNIRNNSYFNLKKSKFSRDINDTE